MCSRWRRWTTATSPARLDAASIATEGRRVDIAPGMAVNAEIITGNRRVIEYVLSPLLRYRDEAGRER
jgi:membrane fusion protein, hemolysin D